MRGFFVGFLALTALEAVVSTQQAASRTSGLLTLVGSLVAKVLDPTVPAISDHRKSG